MGLSCPLDLMVPPSRRENKGEIVNKHYKIVTAGPFCVRHAKKEDPSVDGSSLRLRLYVRSRD